MAKDNYRRDKLPDGVYDIQDLTGMTDTKHLRTNVGISEMVDRWYHLKHLQESEENDDSMPCRD